MALLPLQGLQGPRYRVARSGCQPPCRLPFRPAGGLGARLAELRFRLSGWLAFVWLRFDFGFGLIWALIWVWLVSDLARFWFDFLVIFGCFLVH